MNRFLILLCIILFSGFSIVNAQSSDSIIKDKTYTDLNEALINPDNVFRLDLSNQFLSRFPTEIFKFKNLNYLSLKGDHIKEIPKEIAKLKNLKILDLSGNDFSLLPQEIKSLKNLEEIYLGNNNNLNLNADLNILSKLPNLKILHLENDKIQILPKSINKLKHLEKLYLNENELTDLPSYITNNKKLFYIDMKNNPLQWKGEKPFGITINF